MIAIIKELKKEIPSLNDFKNKLLLIGFVFLYALIFINVYEPFNINEWGKIYYWDYILIGIGVFLTTQVILHFIFKSYRAKLYSVFLYGIIEVAIIAFIFYMLENSQFNTFDQKLKEYTLTFKYTGLVIMVPYLMFFWYVHLRFKLSSLKKYQQTISVDGKKLMSITDENSNLKMAIKPDKLVYVKSAGNYLELFYLNANKLTKELIRGSIKEFESKITKKKILRTHRSYIVNLQYLSSFKKTRKGYALMLEHVTDEVIPISSTYKESFEEVIKNDMSR